MYSIIEKSWRCVEILLRRFTFSPISPCKMGMGTPTGALRGSEIRLFLDVSSIQPTISLGRQVILNMVSSHCFFDLVIITAW